jgi:hypothetical protein
MVTTVEHMAVASVVHKKATHRVIVQSRLS